MERTKCIVYSVLCLPVGRRLFSTGGPPSPWPPAALPPDPVPRGVKPRPGCVRSSLRAVAGGLSQLLVLVLTQFKVSRCGILGQLASSGGTGNRNTFGWRKT